MTELTDILVIDIETVGCESDYHSISERLQAQWDRKAKFIPGSDEYSSQELFNERAGIYAEFGKVVCIAAGYFRPNQNGELALKVKCIASRNEKTALEEFKVLLDKFDQTKLALCAHNGKEFDYPYLCRRMLVNGIKLPYALDISGKKPWEVNHIDTMELWKFGDRKSFTSLDLLAAIFELPSSKGDIDGSMVNEVYYGQNDLEKIAKYCLEDVVVTSQVYLKLNALEPITPNNITRSPITIN